MRVLLGRLTTNRMLGFLTGLAVTGVIQSSSATTVMVVGFVNSGLLTLGQAINVIMGANVGTTVTAWILSLSGIESGNVFVRLLKPSSFTPILALVGIVYYMFMKGGKKKDTGMILLGFATLMFGMETMSGAVSSLKNVPEFQQMFLMFTNPILGVLVGAVLTGIIQSSSASVGILQALSSTGSVTYAAAIPIIMGQNIGTCVTALLSSVGTTKNARRAAVVHLMFNIIGTIVCLTLFVLADALFSPAILGESASYLGIAICHTVFNVICTTLMLPAAGLLEKLVCRIVPDGKQPEAVCELDERLLTTPSIALERCRVVTNEMADVAAVTLRDAAAALQNYTPELALAVREGESKTDHYEDILGTYLVKLSALKISENDSSEAAMLLKALSDFERIGDHALNLVESAEELKSKNLALSDAARHELNVLLRAVEEIVDMTFRAFRDEFRQATLIWLFLLLFGAASCVNIILFLGTGGWMHYLFFPFVLFLVVVVMMVSYAFPLISQFRNDSKSVIKNALIFSVAYLPRTALIVVINVFPWALLLTNLYMFLQVGFIWVVVYFAAAAYINTRLLKKVFAPYMEQEEEA